MNRRAFLALIASAPIAALAPWPTILPQYAQFAASIIPTYNPAHWKEVLFLSGGTGYVFDASPEDLKRIESACLD